jgi:hypothetical protein
LFGFSPEYSHYVLTCHCPNGDLLIGNMVLKDSAGRPLGLMTGYWRLDKSAVASCPKCGVSWPVFGKGGVTTPKPEPTPWSVTEVTETERYEQPIGDDRQTVDAGQSSSEITQTMTFSRQWTQTITIDSEKSETWNVGGSLSVADLAKLQASAENAIKTSRGLSQESSQTTTREVQVTVKAGKRMQVLLHWKKIWQAGVVELAGPKDARVAMPYAVAVDVTFDQAFTDAG